MAGGVRIATAGWSIPKSAAAAFLAQGSHLERYAAVFDAVEINSSFYRPHRQATYARWASATPPGFRFAVKAPKAATHERRLRDCAEIFERFLEEAAGLGDKLAVILVQTPPSLADGAAARETLAALRERTAAALAFEPRHSSWFAPEPEAFLAARRIARVGADPAPVPAAAEPGGWTGLAYRRLHGAPRIYHSPYGEAACARIAATLAQEAAAGLESWCVFDNTADFAATDDALRVRTRLRSGAA